MNNDLISRSALLAEMELDEPDSIDENNREIKAMRSEWKHWMKKIKRFPAVDAVEVVRCKDCKYYTEYESCGLTRLPWYREPDGFCSDGERKENETD